MRNLPNAYTSVIGATIIAVSCLLCSCADSDKQIMQGLGWINCSISVDNNALAPQAGTFALRLQEKDTDYYRTWTNIADFPNYDNFYEGTYIAEAFSGDVNAEGYDCQVYYGSAEFQVQEGEVSNVTINCSLAQTMAMADIANESADYEITGIVFHTMGWSYVQYDAEQSTPALLHPGSTGYWVSIKSHDADITTFDFGKNIESESGHLNTCKISISADNKLTAEWGGNESELMLNDELFKSEAPTITALGFNPDEPVKLVEGYPSGKNISMKISAPAGISSVMLSIHSDNNELFDFPYEFDIAQGHENLEMYGLKIIRDGSTDMTIDFTDMLENITIDNNSKIFFKVSASDLLMRMSDIMTLDVELESVDILEISSTKAALGDNIATIKLKMNTDEVQANDFELYALTAEGEIMQKLPILKSEIDKNDNSLSLTFQIEEGIAPVPIRIYYLGKPKNDIAICRSVPEYALSLDAFSTYIMAQIGIENGSAMKEIAKYVHFYDGEKQYAVTERDLDKGIIKIDGFEPGKVYMMSAIVIDDEYAPKAQIRTEVAEPLPGGDFEDVKDSFSYSNLPQGGVYSTTAFPIYNMQNSCQIDVSLPEKYWGTVNAKTFNRSAKNHNTWYMQVSAQIDQSTSVTGSKSMKISSVGWSVDGEEIEPYVQTEDTYLPYNSNVPAVSHVSAGRLFLGDYSIDANSLAEKYEYGLKFSSRPSSLNGFVKYLPDAQNDYDQGILIVELINDDMLPAVVVSKAEMNIRPCSDFIAFNLPLKYEIFGVKATRLNVMFCSSKQYGDIDYEDQNVPVSADVENSRFIGSQMWIDNLSFSY